MQTKLDKLDVGFSFKHVKKKKNIFMLKETHIMKKCSNYIKCNSCNHEGGKKGFRRRLSTEHHSPSWRRKKHSTQQVLFNPISSLHLFQGNPNHTNFFSLPSQILPYFQHFVDRWGLQLQFV